MWPMTPGTSAFADDDERAGELGFDVDAVVAEQARRVAVQHGGHAGPVALARGAGPVDGHAQARAGAADPPAMCSRLSSCTRMPRSAAAADAEMRFTPSAPCSTPAMAALRIMSVFICARRPL